MMTTMGLQTPKTALNREGKVPPAELQVRQEHVSFGPLDLVFLYIPVLPLFCLVGIWFSWGDSTKFYLIWLPWWIKTFILLYMINQITYISYGPKHLICTHGFILQHCFWWLHLAYHIQIRNDAFRDQTATWLEKNMWTNHVCMGFLTSEIQFVLVYEISPAGQPHVGWATWPS